MMSKNDIFNVADVTVKVNCDMSDKRMNNCTEKRFAYQSQPDISSKAL